MSVNLFSGTSAQEIVAVDCRTMDYFRNLQISPEYEGNLTLKEVSEAKQVNLSRFFEDLTKILNKPYMENTRYSTWPLDLLLDFIRKKHHRYLRENIPIIQFYLDKVSRVHGERHPELFTIKTIFEASVPELLEMLHQDETTLFPLINRLFQAKRSDHAVFDAVQELKLTTKFDASQNAQLQQRHHHRRIAVLSQNYINPKDGCTSYRIGMEKLRSFRDDLDVQAHLKNNHLFVKALQLERYFLGQAKH